MLSDVTWRKMPIDLLTNENMNYIESQMPEGLEYAPFMFYQAALKKAGDDGEFDLEDGVIFARLMRVNDVKIVFMVANLMAQRRVIYHVAAGSNKCLLADWEYSNKQQPRTLAQRRAIVQQQIEAKKAMPIIKEEFRPISAENSQNAFICPDDDKIQKNVVKNVDDDKIQENVVKKMETEREEREIERENRETHTERESLREGEQTEVAACAVANNGTATAATKENMPMGRQIKQKAPKTEEISDSAPTCDPETLSSEALAIGRTQEVDNFQDVLFVVETFFKTKAFGYNPKKGKPKLNEIVKRICELDCDVSKELIAKTFCDNFYDMHNSEGPWKDIPLEPAYMVKDNVWAYLLSVSGKKLLKNKKKNVFLEKAKEYQEAVETEKAVGGDAIDAEYRKYGINPEDPLRVAKLTQVKSQEPEYKGDIF